MFNMEFCKNAAKVGWRCFHNGQVLAKANRPNTCGIIVTGDEVLKGQVLDTNSHFLRKNLYKLGIKVMAVSTISDEINVISSEVKEFSEMYDYVLTTGGIGPTHDDVTNEGVAQAFGDTLQLHPDLEKIVLDFYKTNDKNHPSLKMARIPSKAKLTYGRDPKTKKKIVFPNVSVNNVIMYPGIPELCERLFSSTQDRLFINRGKFYTKELYLAHNEGDVVRELKDAVEKYSSVTFGSYPKYFHSYYTVKISMESIDELEVNEALNYLRNSIPKEFQVEYDTNPFAEKREKISQCKEKYFLEALSILSEVLKTKSPNNIFLYFDGGKNSTITLYILTALYEELYPNFKANAIYVEQNPKVTFFILASLKNYNINLIKFDSANFKYFATCNSNICIIKGTRKSDPDAKLIFNYFNKLSVVNPLINWTYKDVWKTIREFCLPYCELYDQGYSSICHINAMPNSNLKTTGPRSDLVYYKKAFELENENLENA